MTTRQDVLETLRNWVADEYGTDIAWVFDEDGSLIAGEPLDQIPFAYCQYQGLGGLWVEEQWYADVENLCIYLELNGNNAIHYDFDTYEDMKEWIYHMKFDDLIGEADGYVEDYIEEFM